MKVRYDEYLDGDSPKRDIFEAGAQSRQAEIEDNYKIGYQEGFGSRQAEIDELKKELETLQGMHNAVSLTAGDLLDERDELQKRIDKTIEFINLCFNPSKKFIIDTLKGNKNE